MSTTWVLILLPSTRTRRSDAHLIWPRREKEGDPCTHNRYVDMKAWIIKMVQQYVWCEVDDMCGECGECGECGACHLTYTLTMATWSICTARFDPGPAPTSQYAKAPQPPRRLYGPAHFWVNSLKPRGTAVGIHKQAGFLRTPPPPSHTSLLASIPHFSWSIKRDCIRTRECANDYSWTTIFHISPRKMWRIGCNGNVER